MYYLLVTSIPGTDIWVINPSFLVFSCQRISMLLERKINPINYGAVNIWGFEPELKLDIFENIEEKWNFIKFVWLLYTVLAELPVVDGSI